MEAHKGEGRIITVEYERFFVVGSYVPNSGMKLERLAYRTEQWDEDLRTYLAALATRKPTMLLGDLNVAHLDIDIYNVQSKHVAKSAGTTPQERASFGELLGRGWVDGFRHLHPSATGCYTYWSVRAGNRATNRGLRLDYCVLSDGLTKTAGEGLRLHDCWILDKATVGASDHCPVGVALAGLV
uniref:Endonuclease/exonuclease/phosphatase domain-containing protein n=1 Tax=Tetraselmis chuii TaxID=63592 RepID=A0A7S1WYZ2_9CHLO|mmetsp:Transcript_11202/g.20208  ORF Transcript_11202/g.20208 Transcript_11202/m.20208 type:complete len:184 (+) Transcript_11202:627-1178(+)|eukprot:CAMPEP_0177757910 /NCGR_PEP_ID=MMETSP0491_2-20121128/3895_1 /TAXON_ID=63592 /ORGANISM="Tetraselmis chuii, Strain PLY429" /LENGTH=183 /DNA_ID=CAMNT_0019273593 /DNA_START=340 /DNA_END=891 /DNA_ORIENTATION=+